MPFRSSVRRLEWTTRNEIDGLFFGGFFRFMKAWVEVELAETEE